MSLWEQILIGVLGILVLLWVFPGIKPMMERSEKAPKDWKGFLLPITLVILFVLFLISTL